MKLLICYHHLWRMFLGLWDCPIHYLKEIDKIRMIRKRKNWKVAATFSNRFTWSLTWEFCLFQSIFQRTKMTPQQNIILHYITKYRNTIRKHTVIEICLRHFTWDPSLSEWENFWGPIPPVLSLLCNALCRRTYLHIFHWLLFLPLLFLSSKYSAFFMCSCLD